MLSGANLSKLPSFLLPSYLIMPRQKVGWGTTPWSSSSEKAKKLKSRLDSGEIDSYHWTAALLVELFPELELNKHPISSVRAFVKRNAQEINQKKGVTVQKALKDKKRNAPEPPSSPESSLPSSPDSNDVARLNVESNVVLDAGAVELVAVVAIPEGTDLVGPEVDAVERCFRRHPDVAEEPIFPEDLWTTENKCGEMDRSVQI